jgi:hypothetical protein
MTPTPIPTHESELSGSPGPDGFPHVDPGLEALLPARIGDIPLMRMSAPGSDYDHGGDVRSLVCPIEARLMAEAIGASVADVTMAFAFDEQFERYGLVAFRIGGATGDELLAARISLFDSEAPYPMIAERRIGDDSVTVAIRSWFPNDTQFLVVRDDALIVIQYPTPERDGAEPRLPADVARIVAALPKAP